MRRSLLVFAASLALSGQACVVGTAPPAVPLAVTQARSPLHYANEQVGRALAAARSTTPVRIALAADPAAQQSLAAARVTLDARPESYAVVSSLAGTLVVGRDEVGALYGALEVAERLAVEGAAALPLKASLTGAPRTEIRAANLFLVMPTPAEQTWWFQDLNFWTEYLDLMARSRLNYLDLHGMYNHANTLCPNALLYFAHAEHYPDVGAPADVREANARMLARVVEMARERGIKVGLMSYRGDTSLTGAREKSPLKGKALEDYTREAVKDLAERIPGLYRLGFRIGESKHPASWYRDTFVEGVSQTNAPTLLSTRTWVTKKEEIMGLVTSTKRDTLVEAKYNGEQMGPPYLIAGGLMTREKESHFSSYSYEDYLDEPHPYTFIFHIWGGGTNRVFRFANYDHIKRVVESTHHGAARGFSIMPTHAFYPQQDFWHKEAADRYSPWAFRRDELEYLMFGRLGYDPATPERVFREQLRWRVGTDALWDSMQAASEIPIWYVTANACGPDQRQTAPELEWGGPVRFWASKSDVKGTKEFCHTNYHGPLDQFAFASPYEAAGELVSGRGTSRLSPPEVARIVMDLAKRAKAAAGVPHDENNAEARDLVRESVALGHLGEYFAHKFRAAAALAVYERTAQKDYLDEARIETDRADRSWQLLAAHTRYIKPFEEQMRMGQRLDFMPEYHWGMQSLDQDPLSIEASVLQMRDAPPPPRPAGLPTARAYLDTPRGPGPGLAALDVKTLGPGRFRVDVRFNAPPPYGTTVRVLHKGFSGFSDWQSVEARGSGTSWGAEVSQRETRGFFAVEVAGGPLVGWRYPDAETRTPYVVVDENGVH